MSRERRPYLTLRDAIPVARLRGVAHLANSGLKSRFDFTIAATKPVVFVRVKFLEQILAMLADVLRDCNDEIRRLRLITRDAANARKLFSPAVMMWTCSCRAIISTRGTMINTCWRAYH